MPATNRYLYIKKQLYPLLADIQDPTECDKEKKKMRKFSDKYLKQDGVFALMLAGKNTDPVSQADLVCAVYKRYRADGKDLVPNADIPGLYPPLPRK